MQHIVVDWGSSSFRAYLIDDSGRPISTRSDNSGVLNSSKADFYSTLQRHCGDWLQDWPGIPLVMCGMIGSRCGWQEVPYLPCPVNAQALGENLVAIADFPQAKIVPGARCMAPSNAPDVMRGEETQIFGALRISGSENATVVLPGTHSKWAQVERGQIQSFTTFLTGELFALLQRYSSVGTENNTVEPDTQSFIQGLRHSESSGGLLHQIFSVRAKSLFQDDSEKSMSDFLSGVLIGSEFIAARSQFPNCKSLLLVGEKNLQQLYKLAAEHFDITAHSVDPALSVIRGIEEICGESVGNVLRQTQC